MKIYNFNDTGAYIGCSDCQIDPLETKLQGKDIYLLPRNATVCKPPEYNTETHTVYWTGSNWEISPLQLNNIENIKATKIEEFRTLCNKTILSGFNSDCLGEVKHFDCEYTDQSTIQGLAITGLLILQGHSTETLNWKSSGEYECYEWTAEQILSLCIDMKRHIENNINKFNSLRMSINNAETVYEINNISWE